MRTIRLLAASAALATAALGLGTADASAVSVSKDACFGGVQHHDLTTTWTPLPGELVKGGPAAESTVTFKNTAGHDIKDFQTDLGFQYNGSAMPAGAFTVELQAPGGSWKKADFGTGDLSFIVDTGTYQLAKGASVTFKLRIGATSKALLGKIQIGETGGSAVLENDSDTFLTVGSRQPAANQDGAGLCTQFTGDAFQLPAVVDTASTGTSPTPTQPAPSTSTPATVSATPTAPATTQAAHKGTELAETGAGNTVPIAVGGAAALVLGGGIVVALRRRKGSHS